MKTSILEMLSDAAIPVNTSTFRNDAVNFQNRNDVLTYLMHLRYLGYDPNRQTAFVPNEEIRQTAFVPIKEIRQKLVSAVESIHWN